MDHVNDWFFDWLEYHQKLHPNRLWVKTDDRDACEFYAGWIEAFGRMGATMEFARQASRNLQETPPKFLNEHLPAIKTAIYELKKEASAPTATQALERTTPEQARAAMESHECPECGGTGWARRQAHWPSLRWSPMVDLFCRCPHGRWRKKNDADPKSGHGRNYDDLQAWPLIWNPELSFHLWSDRPVSAESIADSETERLWYYLPPGRPTVEDDEFSPLVRSLAN